MRVLLESVTTSVLSGCVEERPARTNEGERPARTNESERPARTNALVVFVQPQSASHLPSLLGSWRPLAVPLAFAHGVLASRSPLRGSRLDASNRAPLARTATIRPLRSSSLARCRLCGASLGGSRPLAVEPRGLHHTASARHAGWPRREDRGRRGVEMEEANRKRRRESPLIVGDDDPTSRFHRTNVTRVPSAPTLRGPRGPPRNG